MTELRAARATPAVGANDPARSVVIGNDRTKLIWTVEAFKAAAFLILGRTRIISFEEKSVEENGLQYAEISVRLGQAYFIRKIEGV